MWELFESGEAQQRAAIHPSETLATGRRVGRVPQGILDALTVEEERCRVYDAWWS